MSVALPYNPTVLRWARERSGFPIEEAARRVNTSVDRVADWEDPDANRKPTVKQARRLAALYGRPFLEFFAKEVPEVASVELVPDFRFHRIPPSDMELAALRGVQQWAEEQRLNALDLMEMLGEHPPEFPGHLYANLDDDIEEIALRVRQTISFPIQDQLQLKAAQRRTLPDILRAHFTGCGILVLKRSGLQKARARGMCLFVQPLPVIIYGNEAPGAQAFTLCHEFAHILLQCSAISADPRFGRTKNKGKKVEGWCNRFAAAFLAPVEGLEQFLELTERPLDYFDDDALSDLADRFGVSRHAMLVRLVDVGYVSREFYWHTKRPQFMREEEEYKPPIMRSQYYGSRCKNRLGDFYTGLVIEAWEGGLISAHNAAEFMGIKNLQHLDDIRRNFGR